MCRRLDRLYLLLLAAVVAAGLTSCGKSPPNTSRVQGDLTTSRVQATSDSLATRESPAAKSAAHIQTDSPVWLEAAREDPDPRVRLHAIETWAIKPGKTLDPVTYALVDPDETVRARAQELFEAALERSNHKNAERVPD